MFFGKRMEKYSPKKLSKRISLHKSTKSKQIKSLDKKVFFPLCRRTACTVSKKKASLTIEAALVLPVFLFFFLGMVSLIQAIQTEGAVRASLWETGKRLATYAYITEMGEEKEEIEKYFGAGAFVYANTLFLQQEGSDYWNQSMVIGGSGGFSFLRSSFLKEDGMIDLVVTYRLKFSFPLLGEIQLPQVQRCRVRGWIGNKDGETEQEGVVYITESGTVYHLTKNCSHLNLTIQELSANALAKARNGSGGKYKPCERCGKEPFQGKYYITKEGDRFHTKRSCSGLKRVILTIPLSQVGARFLCKRCGG